MKNNLMFDFLFLAVAAVCGVVSVMAPSVLILERITTTGQFDVFVLFSNSIEKLEIVNTSLLLLISGLLLGYLRPKIWVATSIFMMIPYPVVSFLETLLTPASHNLFVIELFIYGLLDIPAFIGAFVGSFLARRGRHQS